MHENIDHSNKIGMPKKIITKIDELFETGIVKPKEIQNILRKDYQGEVPSTKQISNHLYTYKNKKYGIIFYNIIYLNLI